MKKYLLVLFSLMCLAQWYVPAAMIGEQERLLSNGKIFRFKTAPVDPSDPFRGKYITLSFEAETFKITPGQPWDRNQNVFVVLKEDEDGFAAVADISTSPPGAETDFVEAEVMFSDEEMVRVRYPFERFYLEESKASEAEKMYWEANRNDSTQSAYAVVRIKNGKSALEDVKVNDQSIVEIVREMNEGN